MGSVRGFKFEICIKSTQHFLELDWLAIVEYMYICFDILNFLCFFFYVQKLVTGLTVRDNDQIYMRYWDDLSLTQLLVGRIGHPKKDRLAE